MPNHLKRTIALTLPWIFLVLTTACGYNFSGGGELPGGIQTVNIRIFENQSGETGIETLLTNDVVNQFLRFDTVRIVEKDQAEAILTGTIKSARIRTIAHKSPGRSTERRITLYLDVTLHSRDGRRIWSASDIASGDSFVVASEKHRTEQNKKSAIANISKRLAERMYYRLTGEF